MFVEILNLARKDLINMNSTDNKFSFNTGVNITFLNDSLNVNSTKYNSSISYDNLDNYTYESVIQPRVTPFALAVRTLVLGWAIAFTITIPIKDEWGGIFFTASSLDIFLAWSSIIIFAGSFLISGLIFWGYVFSAAIQTPFLSRLINNYFSDHGILVTIGNKSGNNIEFYALDNEVSKIKEVEKEILNRRKSITDDASQNTSYSDLKKLKQLHEEGIITEHEFDLKKKQILGL
ncbi:SHOCT domain-containing protein [Flavobacterium sp. Fl-77]|uniref:SHOCT domain-containing protein n=1 Tax=Flavobacterium flavipigmentatum TaxID=2893884 RepID=A0AAJ2S825_9FLAO|nr:MULTISPECIES: SHOCT domain-containing protein [unclassified Flavobacterium]MDX6180634.1 SHOCT domain-containing protein [Flavobacterium sp. Fl-33]MDX6184234.1 SHOCT domain-containing protein [Flavobacterium sp. Fl-77]UFH39346.1 SHOCT domain-containing protein [Flavobacterium sp. F-70]